MEDWVADEDRLSRGFEDYPTVDEWSREFYNQPVSDRLEPVRDIDRAAREWYDW